MFGGAGKGATKNADNAGSGAAHGSMPSVDARKAANDEGLTTAEKKKGTYQKPENLAERMLMNEARQNPQIGRKLEGLNNDPRFTSADGWEKRSMVGKTDNGAVAEVHYQYNNKTGQVADVKATNRNADPNKGFWSSASMHLSGVGIVVETFLRETSLNPFDASEAQ